MTDAYEDLMLPLYSRYSDSPDEPKVSDEDVVQPLETAPMTTMAAIHSIANLKLREDLLAHIYAQDHRFFENLIIEVLLAMGYGGRRRDLVKHLGRSHDGGIDGVVAQDELGLDLIMLQAKRLKPGTSVSAGQVRDFAGGLEACHACKGIFVTTTQFSPRARGFAQSVSRRIVLISGHELTALMIRHNIGVKVNESFVFKDVEKSFFASPAKSAPIC